MKHGAFRNNISRLKKRGEVELAFKSRPRHLKKQRRILQKSRYGKQE
jgi:hypothetical protein